MRNIKNIPASDDRLTTESENGNPVMQIPHIQDTARVADAWRNGCAGHLNAHTTAPTADEGWGRPNADSGMGCLLKPWSLCAGDADVPTVVLLDTTLCRGCQTHGHLGDAANIPASDDRLTTESENGNPVMQIPHIQDTARVADAWRNGCAGHLNAHTTAPTADEGWGRPNADSGMGCLLKPWSLCAGDADVPTVVLLDTTLCRGCQTHGHLGDAACAYESGTGSLYLPEVVTPLLSRARPHAVRPIPACRA